MSEYGLGEEYRSVFLFFDCLDAGHELNKSEHELYSLPATKILESNLVTNMDTTDEVKVMICGLFQCSVGEGGLKVGVNVSRDWLIDSYRQGGHLKPFKPYLINNLIEEEEEKDEMTSLVGAQLIEKI